MNHDEWICTFNRLSKTVPEEVEWDGALHSLADVLVEADLTPDQQALLTGIGALMYRQSLAEFQAGLSTRLTLRKISQKKGNS